MRMPCPTAAAACFNTRSLGFSLNPKGASPAPVAPEETRITSLPWLAKSDSWRTNRSMRSRFK